MPSYNLNKELLAFLNLYFSKVREKRIHSGRRPFHFCVNGLECLKLNIKICIYNPNEGKGGRREQS